MRYANLRDGLGANSSIKTGSTKGHRKGERLIYTKNTMGRYIQAMISREDFLDQIGDWLEAMDDERMHTLREFIFEVDLSETEKLKETLYQYGSCLTEKNHMGRIFFAQMNMLLRQMERNRNLSAKL